MPDPRALEQPGGADRQLRADGGAVGVQVARRCLGRAQAGVSCRPQPRADDHAGVARGHDDQPAHRRAGALGRAADRGDRRGPRVRGRRPRRPPGGAARAHRDVRGPRRPAHRAVGDGRQPAGEGPLQVLLPKKWQI